MDETVGRSHREELGRPHESRDLPGEPTSSIPHQIEGAQLGSIQIVLSAPEFLVGIDPRFELLAAPGMFHNDNQVIKAITRRVSQAWRRGDSTSLERRLG
jgi:hypothetical protein